MAGIGQVFFFFCVLVMDREGVEVYELTKKRGQYLTILTELSWVIKSLVFGFRGNFSSETRRVVPRGKDSSILPGWVANYYARFAWFILPAHGASHIIKENKGSTITFSDGLRLFLFGIAPPSTRNSDEINKKRTQHVTNVVFMLTIFT